MGLCLAEPLLNQTVPLYEGASPIDSSSNHPTLQYKKCQHPQVSESARRSRHLSQIDVS